MEKGELFCTVGGNVDGCNHVESSMDVPQKIKNGFSFRPSYPIAGNVSEETQNTNSKEHMYPYIHCSIIYNCQIWKQPKGPSIDEWITSSEDGGISKHGLLPFTTAAKLQLNYKTTITQKVRKSSSMQV